ncbi:MAG TPA: isochorismate synthase [Acidimicrobiales bacterium]|nr:isochorismate synthase [Acidimicrobiales bacterium]
MSPPAESAAMAPEELSARTEPMAPGAGPDPYEVGEAGGVLFDRPDLVLAGEGVAATIELPSGLESLPDVRAWLAAVPCDDPTPAPGTGVLAFGALPFDRTEPGRLVVPRRIVGAAPDGRRWCTTVLSPGAGSAPPATSRPRAGATGPAGPPVLTEDPPGEAYAEAVARAVDALVAGAARKVVLARALDVVLPFPVELAATLRRLRTEEPWCTVFCYPAGAGRTGAFFGASPELLVARRGNTVVSHPVAGTVALVGDEPGDGAASARLLGSAKDLEEHQLVIDDLVEALRPLCTELDVPASPSTVRLHTVAHLATLLTGRLADGPGGPPDALGLVAAVHPTPAVGGSPRHEALTLLAKLEPVVRGQWAGPVGWMDARGDGDWVLGIRSAFVEGDRAHLLAGAGIVPGSDPAAELAETTLKFVPVLAALAPGAEHLLG